VLAGRFEKRFSVKHFFAFPWILLPVAQHLQPTSCELQDGACARDAQHERIRHKEVVDGQPDRIDQ
jgi:hypothetical protein